MCKLLIIPKKEDNILAKDFAMFFFVLFFLRGGRFPIPEIINNELIPGLLFLEGP